MTTITIMMTATTTARHLTSVFGVKGTGGLLALRPALPTGVGTHPMGVTISILTSSSYLPLVTKLATPAGTTSVKILPMTVVVTK